jgi:lipopolysaccharide biosynthesis glycosyltransferase
MTTQTLDENTIVVVTTADNNYAMPLAVTIRSALENLRGNRKMILFILDGGIKAYNKRKIIKSLSSEKCDVNWISKPDALLGNIEVVRPFKIDIPGMGTITEVPHMSIATYYRLLIPELLPNHIHKAIFLDSDMVIIEDLGKLWDMEMGENYLLAPQDLWTPYVSSPAGLINHRELGIPADAKMFNPAVFVIDLEKWRAGRISAKCIEYLQHNREYIRVYDADVLNAILVGKWGELDPKWNQTSYIFKFHTWKDWLDSPLSETIPLTEEVYNSVRNNPYIVHFSGLSKPWNSKRNHPWKNIWFKYVDMTAWSGWRWSRWRRGLKRLTGKIEKLRDKIAGLIRITD